MKRLARATLALSLIGILGLAACQKNEKAPDPSPKELMQSDRDLLKVDALPGAKAFDESNRNLFSKVFGGPSGQDVANFLDERLKYYFDEKDLDGWSIYPSRFTYTSWKKTADEDKKDEGESRARGEVGASNLGTGLFMQGAVEGKPVVIENSKSGKSIRFDSIRVGMMLVGPGYKYRVNAIPMVSVVLPASYRQGILVHEARHSDCSIEAGVHDFAVARSATSFRDFLARFKKIECGHAHTLCPKDHDFASLPACDRQPFGAYSIGAVFVAAKAKEATSPLDRRILEGQVVSALSRLTFDVKAMQKGELGEPRMKQAPFKW